MLIKSNITYKEYDPDKVVWYKNMAQVAAYVEYGAEIVDVDAQNGRLAIAFWREEHRQLKPLWDEHKLGDNNG